MSNSKLTDGRRIEIINEATQAWGRKDNDVLYLAVSKAIEAEVLHPVNQHEAENFACYLIDKREGEMVTEENVQAWLGAMLRDPQYANTQPAPSAPLEGTGNGAEQAIHVEARQCVECGHVGINDEHPFHAACGYSCGWRGPEPEADECPGCGEKYIMSAACPKCSAQYRLIASANVLSLAPRTGVAGAVPEGWKLVPIKPTGVMKDAGHWALPVGAGGPWTAAAVYRAMLDQVTTPPSADAAAEDKYVIERLSTVLANVAVALLGEEADRPAAETLQKLPKEAAKLRLELDLYRAQAADAAAAPADMEGRDQ
ncbi:hypothetical protein [Burkholderia anthina]|uniref:Gp38 n=1 Tax=Burkholderia anthina TaxID=179879 RepID=A0A6P2GDZ2_9BURK|nr:hypothetical protein [Burkholderia anthina]MBM2769881.1 hypothetical protein [Burkholderia anthina]VVU51855.1 gp38 [Burkholderia anthina]